MSENQNVLITFDIDGTLLIGRNKGSVHRNSFKAALSEIFGVQKELPKYKPGTDLGISKQIICLTTGQQNDDIDNDLLQKYIRKTEDHYIEEFDGQLDIMPGVRECLEAISKLPNVTIGMCTGNFGRIAMLKIEKAKLTEFFPHKIGGFGDNFESRTDILREAHQKAEEVTGKKFDRFIHVGDSPQDVEAANEIGTTSILVQTTPFEFDQKEFPQPDFTFSNLSEHMDDFLSVVKYGKATKTYDVKRNK
ncbi:haloacid dehalogenase-like hydrolase family protein [Tritrichomonas foetus]|uniref:Haloacid dehalogenase-like hydrolase family protein n=1 Tax=Tritrichomonas foetus TaxID=1144522 RepID=A0A1J4J974_9EUKA|nr:haloacid dehalogenase-like hydrolase family protein [Tritrichomonas foetus]|eukprot:OHS93772.1 haloacid dehalogenase-like hydrolase family protein [Tritrichomonas foetus]